MIYLPEEPSISDDISIPARDKHIRNKSVIQKELSITPLSSLTEHSLLYL